MSQQLYDISRTLRPTIAVWPGDENFSYRWGAQKDQGDAVNVAIMTMSAHTGTHMDATYHYDNDGVHPAQMPLHKYLGPAQVITVQRENGPITPDDLPDAMPEHFERILLHTRYSDVPDDAFDDDYPYPTVELIDWLAKRGCFMMAVDMPSVDKFDSKSMPVHHRLKHHKIANLELVMLKDVPDGEYELIALPLKIDDVCGGPVRAILRELN